MSAAYGGIGYAANATGQAVTTTPAKLTGFSGGSAITISDTFTTHGKQGVKPDAANNRMLLMAPGVYRIVVNMAVFATTGGKFDVFIRKNAVVTTIGKRVQIPATTPVDVTVEGILNVTASDNPKTIAPSSATTPSLTGKDLQPLVMVPCEIYVNVSTGSDTLTITDCSFIISELDA